MRLTLITLSVVLCGVLLTACPSADLPQPEDLAAALAGQADEPSGSSPVDGGDTAATRPDPQLLDGGIGACCLGLVCEEISPEECVQRHGRFLGVGRKAQVAHLALVPGFDKGLQRTTGGQDLFDILPGRHGVELVQVKIVGAQGLQ